MLFVLLAVPAHACSCTRNLQPLQDADGVVLPTNARIVLYDKRRRPDAVTLVAPDGSSVPVQVHRYGSGWPWLVVQPEAALAPRTRYAISGPEAYPVWAFRTGKGPDTAAPAWAGVESFEVFKYLSTGGGNCVEGGVAVSLALRPPTDDQTPSDELLFNVWVATAGAAVDYTSPPTAVLRATEGPNPTLLLGTPFTCSPMDPLPTTGAVRFGLRPVDHAGNLGPPHELVADMAAAETRPSPFR